jgi:hypothetical protein
VVLLLILMIAMVDLLPMPTTLPEGERLRERAPQNPRR